MRTILLYLLAGCWVLLLAQCVPARKLEDEKAKSRMLQEQRSKCEEQLATAQTERDQVADQVEELARKVRILKEDTTMCGAQYRKVLKKNKQLNELYEQIIEQKEDLVAMSAAERQKLSMVLAEKEEELNKKDKALAEQQAELKAKSATLEEKEETLEEKEANIGALKKDLEAREERVKELESLLAKKDSSIMALKNRISKALLSFDEDDLSINIKDGKIYVSLAEQLLFGSGSIAVGAKGKEALEKLAEVLQKQTDVSIVVEGHTDDVPISTSCIKDNWHLSVLRATSIVRILLDKSEIDPQRIISSGRGEHLPVASNDSKAGRAKNRRTEIILSPRLDQIFEILEEQ